jgi:hypothetical protein
VVVSGVCEIWMEYWYIRISLQNLDCIVFFWVNVVKRLDLLNELCFLLLAQMVNSTYKKARSFSI